MPRTRLDLISNATIYPDHGAGALLFGCDGDEVVRRVGPPEKRFVVVERTPETPYGPIYAFRYGDALLIIFDGNYSAYRFILGKGYQGKTNDGVGIGSRLTDVIALWGHGTLSEKEAGGQSAWRCDRYPGLTLLLLQDAQKMLRVSGITLTNPNPPRAWEDYLPKGGQLETKKRGLRKMHYKSHDKEAAE